SPHWVMRRSRRRCRRDSTVPRPSSERSSAADCTCGGCRNCTSGTTACSMKRRESSSSCARLFQPRVRIPTSTRRPPMTDLNGVLPVDKPTGPTSHDVVARARRALGLRRIGHTGTLDPFASGLLLLCLGPSTRLAEYLTALPKQYRATMRLGVATDTDDLTGTPITTSDEWQDLSPEAVEAALAAQVGTIL